MTRASNSPWKYLNIVKIIEMLLFISIWIYWIWMTVTSILWPSIWVICFLLLHGLVTIMALAGVVFKNFWCLIPFLLMNVAIQILVQLDMVYLIFFYAQLGEMKQHRMELQSLLSRTPDDYRKIIEVDQFSWYLCYLITSAVYVWAVTVLTTMGMADFRLYAARRRGQENLLYGFEERLHVSPISIQESLVQRSNSRNHLQEVQSPDERRYQLGRTPPPVYRTFLGTLFGTPRGTPPPQYSPLYGRARKY
uniref:Uncharacterized protein n=1 Tax=Acrobeloides nanus TaxID=290746 RepID=A0A914CJV6_9BILA